MDGFEESTLILVFNKIIIFYLGYIITARKVKCKVFGKKLYNLISIKLSNKTFSKLFSAKKFEITNTNITFIVEFMFETASINF